MKAVRASPRKIRPERKARLTNASLHLSCRRHTTRTLAAAMGVSPATAFRLVQELRRQGTPIVSVKEGRAWYFDVRGQEQVREAWKNHPLVKLIGCLKGVRVPRGKPLNDWIDDTLYGQL